MGFFFLIKIVTYITSNIKIDYTEYELFFHFCLEKLNIVNVLI